MPLARPGTIALTPRLCAAILASVAACSSTETAGSGGGSSTSTGVTTATGTGGSSTSSGAGGVASCAQAATMLDVSKAPGAGDGYAKPTLTATCTAAADCVGACPPGSVGCTCGSTPTGMNCIPTCTKDADCPAGMMGQTLTCKTGVCAP